MQMQMFVASTSSRDCPCQYQDQQGLPAAV
jgi:hypothetical protein